MFNQASKVCMAVTPVTKNSLTSTAPAASQHRPCIARVGPPQLFVCISLGTEVWASKPTQLLSCSVSPAAGNASSCVPGLAARMDGKTGAAGPGQQPAVHASEASSTQVASHNSAIVLHPLASHTTTSTVGAAAAAPSSTPSTASAVKRFVRQQVPDDILHDAALNEAIKALPANYNFEIHKTVWRLRSASVRNVALQFPEGLLMYATTIADILTHFAGVEHCMIMGDVTYGACCIDDFSARAMGADFLVHYGHSCLVPVDVTTIPCLYVFVDITMDVDHMVGCVRLTFPQGTNLVLAGTIQFSSGIQAAKAQLAADYPSLTIPKCQPLSPGEVLGCTAPVITQAADAIVFVADGRFHLEAIMIPNPTIPAYRYDPYSRLLTREQYDHAGMRAARRQAIEAARPARRWGVVLGTLGRQGNPRLMETLKSHLLSHGCSVTTFLISELSPQRLALVKDIDAWVQVACPRLSIDWGEAFTKPTLTPYEAMVCLGLVSAWWDTALSQASHQNPSPVSSGQGTAELSAPPHAAGGTARVAEQVQGLSLQGVSARKLQQGCGTQQVAASCATCQPSSCSSQAVAAAQASGSAVPTAAVAEGLQPYPMDYYARNGGPWNSSYHKEVRTKH